MNVYGSLLKNNLLERELLLMLKKPKTPTIIPDSEEYRKLLAARNNFLNFVGHETIIELIKGIIKQSVSFDFRSKNAEKFIEKVNPLFILECHDETVAGIQGEEAYTDALTKLLEDEVCSLVNIEVSKYAKDFLATEKAKFLSETDGEFITHNTFSIIGNPTENIVYLKLLTF